MYGRVDSTSFDDGNSNVFTHAIAHGGRDLYITGQLQNQYRVSQTSAGIGYYSKNIGRNIERYSLKFSPLNKNIQPVTFSQIAIQRKIADVRVGVEY